MRRILPPKREFDKTRPTLRLRPLKHKHSPTGVTCGVSEEQAKPAM